MSESDDTSESSTFQPRLRFVAVHLGVGHVRDERKSLEFAKNICEQVMLLPNEIQQTCSKCKTSITEDMTAENAVIRLVREMEDNRDLNCGPGSNLNMEGQVECDAGLMSNKTGLWTGVGAVPGCKNPILFAKSLSDHQCVPRPLGSDQPNLLIGSGAQQWMQEHCPELSVPPDQLISPRTLSQYQQYKERYDGTAKEEEADGGPQKKQRREDEVVNLGAVGAIAVDHEFNFAAAVSSGGILFKHKGSIGQAAVPGGGCWAHDKIAVVTTRVGEYISQGLMAKSIADYIHESRQEFEDTLEEVFEEEMTDLDDRFNECIHIPSSKGGTDPVGILAVNTFWGDGYFQGQDDTQLFFHYGHNTGAMCIGYMTREDITAHSIISRQTDVVETIVIPYDSHNSSDEDDDDE